MKVCLIYFRSTIKWFGGDCENTVENREIIKNNYTGFLFKNDFELVRLLRKLNNKKLLETISQSIQKYK